MGPTASGKSELAERLADRLDAILVNADAFHVYRGFDIGTNKPVDRDRYRLLDIKDPHEGFGVGEWVTLALSELHRAFEARRHVIVVGGTGLYIRALFESWTNMAASPPDHVRHRIRSLFASDGLAAVLAELHHRNPIVAGSIDQHNPHRVMRALERELVEAPPISISLPAFRRIKLAIEVSREQLELRIRQRTRKLLESGWVEEVESLSQKGVTRDAPAMRAIGYETVLDLVLGPLRKDEAEELITRKTRQYAKRQRTWLRTEPGLRWINGSDLDEALSLAWVLIGRAENE